MKTLTKIIVAIAALFASATFVSCKNVIITVDKLPSAAQSFIQEHFSGNAVSYVKKDSEFARSTYEVVFQDGTEVEFDAKGQWDNIDCRRTAVPAALIPAAIAEYVQNSFPGQIIVKIDKERFGFEIELLNDLELKFDKTGKMIRVDD